VSALLRVLGKPFDSVGLGFSTENIKANDGMTPPWTVATRKSMSLFGYGVPFAITDSHHAQNVGVYREYEVE
jgi:hypothetical protein